MTMLKIATPEDFDTVYTMCKKFIEQTVYNEYMNEDVFKTIVQSFLTDTSNERVGILAFEDDKPIGMIGGAIAYFIFGGVKYATEVAWWVEPEYRKSGIGKELIEAFEYWANQVGCKFVSMSALDKELPKFYEKLDYSFAEVSYIKGL